MAPGSAALEIYYPWQVMVLAFAAAALGFWQLERVKQFDLGKLTAAYLFLFVTLWTGLHVATFRISIDRDRVSVVAPAAIFWTSGTLQWSDVSAVSIRRSLPRLTQFRLHLATRSEAALDLPLSELDRDAIRTLVPLVTQAAAGTEFVPTELEFRAHIDRMATRPAPLFGLLRTRSTSQRASRSVLSQRPATRLVDVTGL